MNINNKYKQIIIKTNKRLTLEIALYVLMTFIVVLVEVNLETIFGYFPSMFWYNFFIAAILMITCHHLAKWFYKDESKYKI